MELRESARPGLFWWVLGAAALILFFCTVFGDLGADSLLGPFSVEGQWLLEARRLATGEDIPLGDWRPGLLAPGMTWLSTLSFELFGVRLEAARGLVGLVSLLTVFLFFRLASRASGTRTALWATLLLLANPLYQSVSRMALPTIFSIFWMLLAAWLWRLGRRNRVLAFLGGAAVVWAGLGENGPDAVFFLGSAVVVMAFLRLHAIKMPWRQATLNRLNAALWGGAALMALLLVMVISNWDAYGRMWDHFTTFNWRVVVSNVVMAPIALSSAVSRMPLTSVLALVYFLFFAKLTVRPVARHRQTNESRMWFLAWLMAGAVYMVFSSPRVESQALLVPPLCLLAGESLVRLIDLRKIMRPRIDVMIVTLMIFGAVWFAVAWMVRGYYHLLPEGFWQQHHIRGTALLVIVLWPLIAFFLTWIYLKWKRFTVPLRSRQVLVLAWMLLIGAVSWGGYGIGSWYLSRPHTVQETASQLARTVGEEDLLVGSWAPLLTLGLPARATMLWSAVNDRPAEWHAEVTHLLLIQGRETSPRRPPVSTLRAEGAVLVEPLATYTLGSRTLELHKPVRQ